MNGGVIPPINGHRKDSDPARPPNMTLATANLPPAPAIPSATVQSPNATYNQIQATSTKRIATLEYLRNAHEGRIYWFNTVHYSRADLSKMPYFDPKKLARRATNYLVLGISLTTVLDLNTQSAPEYLRALNTLLVEFESFQHIHPPDGSGSSLSRARIPQMFKRAAYTKGRRTSSATEIGLPGASASDPTELKSMVAQTPTGGAPAASFFPGSENDLLPGEEYTHLLTPSLPFEPDFYGTFATLCDVLIDCYERILTLLADPTSCGPVVGEMFAKADSRIRKVLVASVVKDFEETSRSRAKSEVAGIGRMVLGPLM